MVRGGGFGGGLLERRGVEKGGWGRALLGRKGSGEGVGSGKGG